jgi:uncharacterized surface protein with fasciclin (FAS1) repeats
MTPHAFQTTSRRALLVAALLSALAGCATVTTPVSVSQTIATTPELSTLNGLLASSGLAETLQGSGPFTVFAPNNDAFKAVPAKTMDTLSKDPSALKGVLNFHVLPGKTLAADVKNSKVKTIGGQELELSKAGEFVTVGESAIVTRADIAATNGVVHVIDAVLLPPPAKK